MLDQQHQRIERFRLDGYRRAVPHEQASFRIDAVPVELVETKRVGHTLRLAEKR